MTASKKRSSIPRTPNTKALAGAPGSGAPEIASPRSHGDSYADPAAPREVEGAASSHSPPPERAGEEPADTVVRDPDFEDGRP